LDEHPKFPQPGFVTEAGLLEKGGIDKVIYQFRVEDTSVGIAEDEIEQLFEAFTQTASGRASQQGTSLGLPISRCAIDGRRYQRTESSRQRYRISI
jgi:K+-sensing histidine kinase KdpD